MTILVDTDALIALVDIDDALHKKSEVLLARLYTQGAELVLLPTTISEFALVATHRIGLEQTKAVLGALTGKSGYGVMNIDQELTDSAVKLFQKQTSKEESLFDCFVMAAVERYGYDAIFSFDKGYLKKINAGQKLKLASGLFV